MENHRSCRLFDPTKPISDATIASLLEVAHKGSSTSSFLQQYHVVNVKDPEIRKQFAELSGGQEWISTASQFLVFFADRRHVHKFAENRDRALETTGNSEMGLMSVIDTTVFAQNFLFACESVGLGGCFIGGIRNDLGMVGSYECHFIIVG